MKKKDFLSNYLSENLVHVEVENKSQIMALDENFNIIEMYNEMFEKFSVLIRNTYNFGLMESYNFTAQIFDKSIYHHKDKILLLSSSGDPKLYRATNKLDNLRKAMSKL